MGCCGLLCHSLPNFWAVHIKISMFFHAIPHIYFLSNILVLHALTTIIISFLNITYVEREREMNSDTFDVRSDQLRSSQNSTMKVLHR